MSAECQDITPMDVKRTAPLRNIVRNEGDYDLLECGHRVLVNTDGLGRQRPAFYRRRCRYCGLRARP